MVFDGRVTLETKNVYNNGFMVNVIVNYFWVLELDIYEGNVSRKNKIKLSKCFTKWISVWYNFFYWISKKKEGNQQKSNFNFNPIISDQKKFNKKDEKSEKFKAVIFVESTEKWNWYFFWNISKFFRIMLILRTQFSKTSSKNEWFMMQHFRYQIITISPIFTFHASCFAEVWSNSY